MFNLKRRSVQCTTSLSIFCLRSAQYPTGRSIYYSRGYLLGGRARGFTDSFSNGPRWAEEKVLDYIYEGEHAKVCNYLSKDTWQWAVRNYYIVSKPCIVSSGKVYPLISYVKDFYCKSLYDPFVVDTVGYRGGVVGCRSEKWAFFKGQLAGHRFLHYLG